MDTHLYSSDVFDSMASPLGRSEGGFAACNAAEYGDPGKSMQSESTRGFPGAKKPWDDLAMKIDHLAFLIYLEACERIVEYRR